MYSSNDLVMNVFILSGYPNGKIKNVIGHNVMNTNTLQSKFPKLKSWAKRISNNLNMSYLLRVISNMMDI